MDNSTFIGIKKPFCSAASYDLRPGNGAGPIFWKVRDRRRNRREGKTHKKGRRNNTSRKGNYRLQTT